MLTSESDKRMHCQPELDRVLCVATWGLKTFNTNWLSASNWQRFIARIALPILALDTACILRVANASRKLSDSSPRADLSQNEHLHSAAGIAVALP